MKRVQIWHFFSVRLVLPSFKPWENLAGDRLWAGHLKGQLRLGEEVFSSPDSSFFFVQVLVQAVLGISWLQSVTLSACACILGLL